MLGLYSSAVPRTPPFHPPATRTLPVGRSVAAAEPRPVMRLAAEDQLLVLGLYSSALFKTPLAPFPPATRTWPSPSRVTVANSRPMLRLAAEDQLLVLGVYSSA